MRLWLMRVVIQHILHLCTKFEIRRRCRSDDYGARCVSALMGLVTLTFDLLALKLVGNLHSKFGHARPLGSRVIRYVRDGRTDRRTKANLTAPFLRAGP